MLSFAISKVLQKVNVFNLWWAGTFQTWSPMLLLMLTHKYYNHCSDTASYLQVYRSLKASNAGSNVDVFIVCQPPLVTTGRFQAHELNPAFLYLPMIPILGVLYLHCGILVLHLRSSISLPTTNASTHSLSLSLCVCVCVCVCDCVCVWVWGWGCELSTNMKLRLKFGYVCFRLCSALLALLVARS